MIRTAIAIIVTTTIQSGIASQYAFGVMELVVTNRQNWNQLPADLPKGVSGYIAVLGCDAIGEIWLIKPEGGKWEQFMVADCAGGAETIEWMKANRILVEVGHDTAIRWDTVGKGIKVEVLTENSVNEKMYRRDYEPL